jgi:hypothetical protein
MEKRPAPHKWSKLEILGHLVDSAINNYQRILLAQLKDDLLYDGYDQVAWVRLNEYQSRNVDEVIRIWESINRHIASLISNITPARLHRKTLHHRFDKMSMKPLPKGSEASLAYLIWDYLFHLEHHLSQIIDDYHKRVSAYETQGES